jgi:hypothetical protein
MDWALMTKRCDYCRGKFGLVIHRYWRMRFCCAACAHAYQQRLHGVTRAKIRRLEVTPAASACRGAPARQNRWHW